MRHLPYDEFMDVLRRQKPGEKFTLEFLKNVPPNLRNTIKYGDFDQSIAICERCPDGNKFWRTGTLEQESKFWRHVKNRQHFSNDASLVKVLFYQDDLPFTNVDNYDNDAVFQVSYKTLVQRQYRLVQVTISTFFLVLKSNLYFFWQF